MKLNGSINLVLGEDYPLEFALYQYLLKQQDPYLIKKILENKKVFLYNSQSLNIKCQTFIKELFRNMSRITVMTEYHKFHNSPSFAISCSKI